MSTWVAVFAMPLRLKIGCRRPALFIAFAWVLGSAGLLYRSLTRLCLIGLGDRDRDRDRDRNKKREREMERERERERWRPRMALSA